VGACVEKNVLKPNMEKYYGCKGRKSSRYVKGVGEKKNPGTVSAAGEVTNS
jgi:hypothetical protein